VDLGRRNVDAKSRGPDQSRAPWLRVQAAVVSSAFGADPKLSMARALDFARSAISSCHGRAHPVRRYFPGRSSCS
jgi:hypothetical protein